MFIRSSHTIVNSTGVIYVMKSILSMSLWRFTYVLFAEIKKKQGEITESLMLMVLIFAINVSVYTPQFLIRPSIADCSQSTPIDPMRS